MLKEIRDIIVARLKALKENIKGRIVRLLEGLANKVKAL